MPGGLTFSRPRRHQDGGDAYFVRVRSGGGIALSGAKVVDVRTIGDDGAAVMYLRLSVSDRREVQALEASIKAAMRDNVCDWFRSSIDSRLIDEYYQHCMVYDCDHGLVFKVRAPAGEPAPVPGRSYNVDVGIRGLVIRTTSYGAEFGDVVLEPVAAPGARDVSDDDGDSVSAASDSDVDSDVFPVDELHAEARRLLELETARLKQIAAAAEETRRRLECVDLTGARLREIDAALELVSGSREALP